MGWGQGGGELSAKGLDGRRPFLFQNNSRTSPAGLVVGGRLVPEGSFICWRTFQSDEQLLVANCFSSCSL